MLYIYIYMFILTSIKYTIYIYIYCVYTNPTGVRLFEKLEQVFYYKRLKKRANVIIKKKL